MKKLLGLLIGFAFSFSAFAEDNMTIINPADNYVVKDSATVQIMNKQAGKVQTVTALVNKKVSFDKLEFVVKKCLTTNEFLPEDFFAFIEIKKSGNKIFSGWMTKSEPGQNPLQDSDNDLWLVRCD